MATIPHPLEFERPLVELEDRLEKLSNQISGGDSSLRDEYAKLESKVAKLRAEIYGKLSSYQRVQLSRHFDRPCSLDFFNLMTTNFIEFHGDRVFGDDAAIVAGTARLAEYNVVLVGHQRGRTTQERIKRNFGMPQPEGYRKALRMFEMAEKFRLPVINLIDTQGAFPGKEAEERGQAEAIARNLYTLAELTTPLISVIIGEGGSGGALALGVTDRILMLENACYSVITPEGCASILWGSEAGSEAAAKFGPQAAELLQLTAQDLKRHQIIDEIVPEPLGGAHRNYLESAENLKAVLLRILEELGKLTLKELLDQRYQKFRKIGRFTGSSLDQ